MLASVNNMTKLQYQPLKDPIRINPTAAATFETQMQPKYTFSLTFKANAKH